VTRIPAAGRHRHAQRRRYVRGEKDGGKEEGRAGSVCLRACHGHTPQWAPRDRLCHETLPHLPPPSTHSPASGSPRLTYPHSLPATQPTLPPCRCHACVSVAYLCACVRVEVEGARGESSVQPRGWVRTIMYGYAALVKSQRPRTNTSLGKHV
jgi:hypothetical protein